MICRTDSGSSLSGINGAIRPGIVHRIDRDTSGLIIAAKNDRAHLALAAQLQDHSLARVYEAVTVGGLSIWQATELPVDEELAFFNSLTLTETQQLIAAQILKEIRSRLGFLQSVGLSYLTLSRSSGTLQLGVLRSGGSYN